MRAFSQACLDVTSIGSVILSDDSSSEEEVRIMKRELDVLFGNFATIEVLTAKNDAEKGLAASLNRIWDNVKTRYIYHLEDDWEYVRKGNILAESFRIINESEGVIKSVLSRRLEMYTPRTLSDGTEYFICERGIDRIGHRRGHGYSLNPSLQDFEFFRSNFHSFRSYDTENSFGDRMYDMGYRVATVGKDYVVHSGEISAFDINNTNR
jgi:hypothetical protein